MVVVKREKKIECADKASLKGLVAAARGKPCRANEPTKPPNILNVDSARTTTAETSG
jgi:hypothetical protein